MRPSTPNRPIRPRTPSFLRVLSALTALAALVPNSIASAEYLNFEAGHVRPLALAPDGSRLFAVNTPDNRLAIFDVTADGLRLAAEIPVGLRPVAVAVRDAGGGSLQAWVVNHLSDSVSIVAVASDAAQSRVVDTLLVGDEPRDLVFGGVAGQYAFITTARRGQNAAVPPVDFALPGTPRALVWVYDAASPGGGVGGAPVNVIELLADTPRALAVTPDGTTVYAAAFRSGNGTTALSEFIVGPFGGSPPPPPGSTPGAPETSLIVKHDPLTDRWEDEIDRDWGGFVPFGLPDLDVFAIDATANPPVAVPGGGVAGVGTNLFNMAVRPDTGTLWVSNFDARNEVRFENMVGSLVGLRGHLGQTQISLVSGVSVVPIDLNAHVDYSVPTGPAGEVARSLGTPLEIVFDAAGDTAFVAAFGSSKVAVLDTDDLEGGTVGTDRIDVPGGPSGLALDENLDRLYVMSRFDQIVTVVESPADPGSRSILAQVELRDPEPPEIVQGRPFLYDAAFSSGHGDVSCGTCHLFGDMDKLAWDLGNPFGTVEPNPNPQVINLGGFIDFHPLKGPMTTQSLRGLPGQGPLHWRGDQTNAANPLDVRTDFGRFSGAFVSLLGRSAEPTPSEFGALTDFTMALRYPPNPVHALDDVPTAAEAAGEDTYTNVISALIFSCNNCHRLPTGTSGASLDEDGVGNFIQVIGSQVMKIPHLRNAYDKVGAYASGGDEVSGFGFIHDGTTYSLSEFLAVPVFSLNGQQEDDVEAFIMGLDTGVKSIVGQQLSLRPGNVGDAGVAKRLALLEGQADLGNCDLVVKGSHGGEARGAVYEGGGSYRPDRAQEPSLNTADLLVLAGTPGQEQVLTCAPLGTGVRMGIDRDEDGFLDRDELDASSDPANPASIPAAGMRSSRFSLRDASGAPERRRLQFRSATRQGTPAGFEVPGFDGTDDPTISGATLTLYRVGGSPGDVATIVLPAKNWERNGEGRYRYRDARRVDGPIKSVVLREGLLKINGNGAGLYGLGGAPQGALGLRLRFGPSVEFCAEAPARAPASKFDTTSRFLGEKDSAAPAPCPPTP